MKAVTVFCGLLLLVGAPAVLGTRQLSAVFGTGVLPQPGLDSLGSLNTLAANPVVTPAASPAAAPLGAAAAAPEQAPVALAAPAAAPALAALPADVAVVAPAPASKAAVSGAAFGAHAPAPGPSAARRRRVALRNSVFILDADYATLTIPDPSNPDDGTLELSGFSRHVSYFTDARGTGVRRSGRIPITNFANTTFPDTRNATANGTANSTASSAMPNAALYASDASYYASQSDRLLRVVTLRGKPAASADNSTLTFNVTVAPSFSDDDVVTVYRVSYNATNNSTGNGTDVPQVTEAQFGTTTTYESVALYVGNWWWGQETDAANVRRHEQRREQRYEQRQEQQYEQRQQNAFANWYWP